MSFFKKHPKVISILALLLGLTLIILGIYRGEVMTVFNKATRICMECIGIG